MAEKKQGELSILLGYAGSHKALTIVGCMLSVIAMLMGMAPYICIWLVARDLIAVAPDWEAATNIATYGWAAFGFAVGGIVVYFFALMCTHLAAFRTASNIRKQGMAHMMSTPLGYFDNNASGLIRNRLDGGAGETETLLAHNLADISGTVAMLVGVIVLMVVFDWRMGVACLLAAVISIVAMFTMMGGKNASLMAEYQAAQDRMSKAGVEYVRGIPVVKVFQQTVYSFKAFKEAIDDYSDKAGHYQGEICRMPQTVNLTFTEGAFMFLVPVALVLAPGALDSGDFARFVTDFAFYAVFSAIISTALAKVMFAASGMMLASTALGRISKVMDAPVLEAASNPLVPQGNRVEFKDVTFTYAGAAEPALKNASIVVEPGQTVALVGPSGGGKTTAASLIPRFWDVDSGAVEVGGATVAFLALSLVTHYQQYHATYGLVYEEIRTMRLGLAERLRKLPLGYFGKRDLADLTETIMGDVNRMEHVWSHVLGYLYGGYISTAIIAVMLLAMDWRLAIACMWGVPVAFALLFGSRHIAGNHAEMSKAAAVSMADGMQETLENIREIHATNQEQRYLEALYDKIDECERTKIRSEFVTGLFVNGASVIMRLGVATTVLVGANLILSGQVDFMLLFMFLLVITRVYAPFDQSLALIAEVFMSQVSVNRLMEIYDTPTAEGAMVFEPAGHDIVFRNVGFAYDDEQVLHDVSFTAKEGEVTALVGPSGSGKSTCARLAARLWDIPQGTIEVGGIDISTVDPEVLLGDYSMVFQDVTLFDGTIMENIRLGKHGATDEEVRAAAAAANCDEFVNKLPQGYDTPIGENGAKLSGGERQRISIARTLLKDAPIVLLDEATASLDVENETKVQSALSRLLAGKTVLVIAHRMRTVEAADKIIVLSEGAVAEEGSPTELLAREDGLFARMANLQAASADWSV